MTNPTAKLQELGITLPESTLPAANYIPYTVSGKQVIVSGQLPMKDGKPQFIGKVGKDFNVEQAQECARLCGINILSHVRAACGGELGKVKKVLRLGIFVNATQEFTEPHLVANGVSNFIVDLFGLEKGKHARFAVVVAQLPMGVAVEVDGLFELE